MEPSKTDSKSLQTMRSITAEPSTASTPSPGKGTLTESPGKRMKKTASPKANSGINPAKISKVQSSKTDQPLTNKSTSAAKSTNEEPKEKAKSRLGKCQLKKGTVFLLLTMGGCAIGVILGASIRAGLDASNSTMTAHQVVYLNFPGEMFIRMLTMTIIPLVVSSIISSMTQMNTHTAGRMGMLTMAYYMATTFLAVIEGIIWVEVINPGGWTEGLADLGGDANMPCLSVASDTILDMIRNLFPSNLVQAWFNTVKTCLHYKNGSVEISDKIAANLSEDMLETLTVTAKTDATKGANILGLIVFSMIFGVMTHKLQDEGLPLKHLFVALESVMMKIVSLVLWYAPIGIIFLIASQIVGMENPLGELQRLAGYTITVLIGLAVHGFIILPLIMFAFTRQNPYKFAYGMLPALLTAFGTSSSSATLPLTIKCCEENNKMDRRVTRFMLPLGATINMDGTALYEAVAALYIAQALGREMSFDKILLVSITATLAAIGAAGIPQAGIVTMIMVLQAVGLPQHYFALILPVDWFLDRCRTCINVFGDALGTPIIQKYCQKQLNEEVQISAEPSKNEQTKIEMEAKV